MTRHPDSHTGQGEAVYGDVHELDRPKALSPRTRSTKRPNARGGGPPGI